MENRRLKRASQPMPEDIAARLNAEGVTEAYRARPAYQRNDYLGWIARAKKTETRQKRIEQMVEELRGHSLYMRMPYRERGDGRLPGDR